MCPHFPSIPQRPLIQPPLLQRCWYCLKRSPMCIWMSVMVSGTSRTPIPVALFHRSPLTSVFLKTLLLSPTLQSYTPPCPSIPRRPLIRPPHLQHRRYCLKHPPMHMGLDSSMAFLSLPPHPPSPIFYILPPAVPPAPLFLSISNKPTYFHILLPIHHCAPVDCFSWDALRESITGIVNRVNVSKIKHVVPGDPL
jgi:hypothetical protein